MAMRLNEIARLGSQTLEHTPASSLASGLGGWGGLPHAKQILLPPSAMLNSAFAGSILARGNGRSYGDVAINSDGSLLDMRLSDRILAIDANVGQITCQPGVTMSRMLGAVRSLGWFPPVLPGTGAVTIGGAIANDVHGKNHQAVGSFGAHVVELYLRRSTGELLHCSTAVNPEIFSATIGGLGLTGIIEQATLQMMPVASPTIRVEAVRFDCLREFFALSHAAERTHEYIVGWLDMFGGLQRACRGVLHLGGHAAAEEGAAFQFRNSGRVRSAFAPPVRLVSQPLISVFNHAYFFAHRHKSRDRRDTAGPTLQSPEAFFFPLDRITNWNRLYGRKGFYQYQFLIPSPVAQEAMEVIVREICATDMRPTLAVIKIFGNSRPCGMLSFAREGATLALDFPNYGQKLLNHLERLDTIVRTFGGRVYAAKDARMSRASYSAGGHDLHRFNGSIDHRFMSDFWRRVGDTGRAR